nr:hypothetical protein [Pandoravirus massiliensis]
MGVGAPSACVDFAFFGAGLGWPSAREAVRLDMAARGDRTREKRRLTRHDDDLMYCCPEDRSRVLVYASLFFLSPPPTRHIARSAVASRYHTGIVFFSALVVTISPLSLSLSLFCEDALFRFFPCLFSLSAIFLFQPNPCLDVAFCRSTKLPRAANQEKKSLFFLQVFFPSLFLIIRA